MWLLETLSLIPGFSGWKGRIWIKLFVPFNVFCSSNIKMFFVLQSVGGKLEVQLISKRFCCCFLSCSFSRLKKTKQKNLKKLFCPFSFLSTDEIVKIKVALLSAVVLQAQDAVTVGDNDCNQSKYTAFVCGFRLKCGKIIRFVIFKYTKKRFSETIPCIAACKHANELMGGGAPMSKTLLRRH